MYNLTDPDKQARLTELAAAAPDDLSAEIALCRQLTEASANAGNIGLTTALLNTQAKLSAAFVSSEVRKANLLSKRAVLLLARDIVETLFLTLRDQYPGIEETLMDCSEAIALKVQRATNDTPLLESK